MRIRSLIKALQAIEKRHGNIKTEVLDNKMYGGGIHEIKELHIGFGARRVQEDKPMKEFRILQIVIQTPETHEEWVDRIEEELMDELMEKQKNAD